MTETVSRDLKPPIKQHVQKASAWYGDELRHVHNGKGTIYEQAIPNSDSRCLPDLFKAKRDQPDVATCQPTRIIIVLNNKDDMDF